MKSLMFSRVYIKIRLFKKLLSSLLVEGAPAHGKGVEMR